MMDTKPKRVIDRERQWRKIDAGHYTSPKGRFHATRDDGDWMLVDTTGEIEPQWFARWRDARRHVEQVEFADEPLAPIEIREDEIRDDFHNVVRLQLVRGEQLLGDVVIREGEIEMPQFQGPVAIDEAEAFATALMLATHHAAQMEKS
jgi:hypothetical protein